jgi:ketosteroid isomerase-like protein
MSPAEQAILATDDARIAAAKNSDAAALDSIYADDFQLITHNGLVRGKREQVDDYRTGALRYVSFELVERKIQMLDTVGVVWSRERSVILYQGTQDVGGDRRITRIWVLRDSRWQLLSAHASEVQ